MSLCDEEHTAAVISCVSHLLGCARGTTNGQLKLVSGRARHYRSRREMIPVENVNLENAKKWEAGALLESVAGLGFIPKSEIEKYREKINLSKANTRTTVDTNVIGNGMRPPAPPPAKASRNSNNVDNRGWEEECFDQKPPSGFMPPRRVPNTHNDSTVKSTNKRLHSPPRSAVSNSLFDAVAPAGGKPAFVQQQQQRMLTMRSGRYNDVAGSELANKENSTASDPASAFRTAREQLVVDDKIKGIRRNLPESGTTNVHVSGLRKPMKADVGKAPNDENEKPVSDNPEVVELMAHENMKNVDPKMVEAILNEVVQTSTTDWSDIAGLEGVKNIIREIIIWPMLRPDIFTGLRASPRGILFFGPPGTGKTMFGRLIATQSQSTFFNISASSLTSKWIGDGEKMVRALFQVARLKQPAVIFIDEIDSILTQRSDTEHESSRRLKTEFLIQFDGCGTQSEDRILVIGVTNRPQELDEAARRRLVKRIYIPLPDYEGRKQLVKNLLRDYTAELTDDDYSSIANMTDGYSGADMTSLCREAAYGPIREVGHLLLGLDPNNVRAMQMKDFVAAQRQVKSSVAKSDVELYADWDAKFGCHV